MNRYRVTIRHGRPARYHVEDVEAGSLPDAMRLAADRIPGEVGATGDLVEVRLSVGPDDRQYGPG